MLPEYIWYPWLFEEIHWGYWSNPSNQLAFMDWFAKEFEIETQEDWYLTEFQDYERWGGGGLLHQVQNSLINLWATIYPQYIWYPWYCSQTPKGYWDDRANRKLYFDWAAEQLGIEIAADWYSIRVTL
jgi:hypothetical protein